METVRAIKYLFIMKLIFNLFLFSQLCSFCYSQTNVDITSKENSYVFRFLPSTKDNIYGIAFGIVGSETVCNFPNTKNSHGINIQIIGQGLFIPLNRNAFGYKTNFMTDSSYMVKNINDVLFKAKHNGLLISGFGTMTDITNGISISFLSSMGYYMNGISINLLSSKYTNVNGLSIAINNEAYKVNGIQIGLINRTNKLKGFQFGIWNVNSKRRLPFINWNFKESS